MQVQIVRVRQPQIRLESVNRVREHQRVSVSQFRVQLLPEQALAIRGTQAVPNQITKMHADVQSVPVPRQPANHQVRSEDKAS